VIEARGSSNSEATLRLLRPFHAPRTPVAVWRLRRSTDPQLKIRMSGFVSAPIPREIDLLIPSSAKGFRVVVASGPRGETSSPVTGAVSVHSSSLGRDRGIHVGLRRVSGGGRSPAKPVSTDWIPCLSGKIRETASFLTFLSSSSPLTWGNSGACRALFECGSGN
jgi:hypothetical protein